MTDCSKQCAKMWPAKSLDLNPIETQGSYTASATKYQGKCV